MAVKNNPTGFRGVIHFFSCWGFGDACVALIGALLALAGIGGEGRRGGWLDVGVGVCAIVIYAGIAGLSRPDEPDDQQDATND